MSEPLFRFVGTAQPGGIVAVCDHASNNVPQEIELGVSDEVLEQHIAYDIGTAGVVGRLARRHNIGAMMAGISRLVIDLHREENVPGLIPEISDGVLIPGNIGANREQRLQQFYRPYHDAMAAWLDEVEPALILSIHSFTPRLQSAPADRPWEVALLYNNDNRAALHAMRLFADRGLVVGENEPYSGREFNATMNRHAEAFGRPYCAIEIRNDLIETEAGQARWAALLAEVAGQVKVALSNSE